MKCKKEQNKLSCKCTFDCNKKGICCECIKHHKENRELPGCFFTEEAEKTYDRSFEHFARLVNENKV
ncbi:cytosolic protein [archaeon]|jgi:hypothetical protein|nr:cytosolic protein [archaeon]MBT3451511.1 cytosolic protein [archaeon]MBT6869504.1 cytosolic protein [archaeon]MBT7193192.1 cytosolic protein [archaeon]MBT7380498.1 cytosolic protein [archaeon]